MPKRRPDHVPTPTCAFCRTSRPQGQRVRIVRAGNVLSSRTIQSEPGKDMRHGQRVLDIGLAGDAFLAVVRLLRQSAGAANHLDLGGRALGRQLPDPRVEVGDVLAALAGLLVGDADHGSCTG